LTAIRAIRRWSSCPHQNVREEQIRRRVVISRASDASEDADPKQRSRSDLWILQILCEVLAHPIRQFRPQHSVKTQVGHRRHLQNSPFAHHQGFRRCGRIHVKGNHDAVTFLKVALLQT
jgi:hypothetical protein